MTDRQLKTLQRILDRIEDEIDLIYRAIAKIDPDATKSALCERSMTMRRAHDSNGVRKWIPLGSEELRDERTPMPSVLREQA